MLLQEGECCYHLGILKYFAILIEVLEHILNLCEGLLINDIALNKITELEKSMDCVHHFWGDMTVNSW